MYRISLNGRWIGPWLSDTSVNYWYSRLAKFYPSATVLIVRSEV